MVISNPDISTVLVGAKSVEEVEQNVRAVEAGPLPSEVLSRLQEIADMVPFRPFEEPHSLAFGRKYAGPGPAPMRCEKRGTLESVPIRKQTDLLDFSSDLYQGLRYLQPHLR